MPEWQLNCWSKEDLGHIIKDYPNGHFHQTMPPTITFIAKCIILGVLMECNGRTKNV